MNTRIVLMIVLKLIYVVHSADYYNISEDVIVPVKAFPKTTDDRQFIRTQQHYYTRWITTPFIVKVPDETEDLDDTTVQTPVDAFNRIPVTEYTRFILPQPDVSRTTVGGREYRRHRFSTPTPRRMQQRWSAKISTEVSTPAHKRHKRAPQMEYKRWTLDTPTSSEFIVKVPDDDDDNYTPLVRVATKMLPVTRNTEKIVLGGAIVTPKRTTTTTAPIPPRNYTRFAPLAPDVQHAKDIPERTPPIIYVEALKPERTTEARRNHIPNRNPLRDESPLAGPQFLPHSPVAGPREFAHLEPVEFTSNGKHIKPPGKPSGEKTREHDVVSPRGSLELDELNKAYKQFELDELNENYDTRTTISSILAPSRDSKFDRPLLEAFHELVDEISRDIYTKDAYTKDTYTTETYTKDLNSKQNTERYFKASESDLDVEKESYIDEKNENDVEDPIEDAYSEISKNLDSVELLTKDIMKAIDSEYPGIFNDSETNYGDIDYPEKTFFRTYTAENDTRGKLKHFTVEEAPALISARKKPDACSILDIKVPVLSRLPTLPEVNNRLKRWDEQSPIAKVFDITYGNLTFLENPIYAIVVDDPSRGQVISAKKSVMVIGGIQGRDHYAVATAMYVLYQLIEKSEKHADLLTKYRFLVIPVFNPDGYDYSMTFAHRRDWTKNLRQSWDTCADRDSCKECSSLGLSCTPKNCFGVNLDRNFEYQWLSRNELSGEHPCGDLYPGPRQISEPETIALTQYLLKLKLPVYAFITFKEGDVLGVLYPYSHTKRRRAHDNLFRQRADLAAAAAAGIDDRPYVSGQSSEYLRLYAGGIEDWVDAHLGVDYTFSVMLNRPHDAKRTDLKTEFVVYEGYAALEALLLSKVKDSTIAPVAKLSESMRRQGKAPRARTVKSGKPDRLYFTYFLSLMPLSLCIFEIIK